MPRLFTSKLDINLRKDPVNCYIWSKAFYDADPWTLRKKIPEILRKFLTFNASLGALYSRECI